MKSLRVILALGSAFAAVSAWAADPLRMSIEPTFSGFSDTSVMTVVLENDGPDARGAVRVSGESGETTYPVELPRGARKKLLTLPEAPWGEVVFTLETNHGDVTQKIPAIPPPNDFSGGTVLLVGDDNGGLGFLRKVTEGKQSVATRDMYVTAEGAPDRPAAYRYLNAVILGPGSERLPDGAAKAIKEYALSGGKIIFLGGASAPILEDVHWAEMLPGKGWRPKTLSSSAVLAELGAANSPGPFTILTPDIPASGTKIRYDGGSALESERGYGLGSVVVLGYSPIEPPLSTWDGRGRLVSRFVRSADRQRARVFTASFQETSGMSGTFSSPVPASTGAAPAAPVAAFRTPSAMSGMQVPVGDPFSTTLPATSTVFGILAAYFVLVVPGSFLVLRKLKKGELAWFTAPILSLAFAGLLFKSAQSLYAASLSTATTGVLVVQEGSPDAMFFGSSQLFFPRGGVYDLKLSGVDRMTAVQQEQYYGYGSRENSLQGFNAVDVGEVKAPELEADNLAFRDLSYSQRVDSGDWFHFQKVDKNHIRVENRSPYNFDGSLANGDVQGNPIAIRAGQTSLVELGSGAVAANGQALAGSDPRNFTRADHRIALYGVITGFRPGPQIGTEVANRSGIALVAFAQETTQ